MKSSALLLTLLTFSAFSALGQRNRISLSLGPALPVGEFGNQDGRGAQSGLALVGGLLDLSFEHAFKSGQFGLSGTVRARINGVNENAELEPLKDANPGYTWTPATESWAAAAALIGVYHRSGLGSKLQVMEKISIGCAEALLPGFSTTAVRNPGPPWSNTDYLVANNNKAYATAPTAVLQVGVSYPLTRRFYLLANLDFWYLRPTFKNIRETTASAHGLNVPNLYSLTNGIRGGRHGKRSRSVCTAYEHTRPGGGAGHVAMRSVLFEHRAPDAARADEFCLPIGIFQAGDGDAPGGGADKHVVPQIHTHM